MTAPNDFELLELATPYALDAVTDLERADIDRRLGAAPSPVAAAFGDEVRAVRETMAIVSAASAAEPPAQLRAAILALAEPVNLATRRQSSWRTTAIAAAAAAVVVGAAAFGVGVLFRPPAPTTVAEQVLAAPDVRTVSGQLGGGTATVMFSRDRNAGVLVMNNVPPPSPGTVYQMWLIDAKGPTSAGTMDTAAVAPSTKATLDHLGASTTLAFTVEPGTGSPQPTGKILAALPLT
jgi:anti-sigma-K factor RskA